MATVVAEVEEVCGSGDAGQIALVWSVQGHRKSRGLTSKIYAPSSSAGTGTWSTVKNGNVFQLVKAITAHFD